MQCITCSANLYASVSSSVKWRSANTHWKYKSSYITPNTTQWGPLSHNKWVTITPWRSHFSLLVVVCRVLWQLFSCVLLPFLPSSPGYIAHHYYVTSAIYDAQHTVTPASNVICGRKAGVFICAAPYLITSYSACSAVSFGMSHNEYPMNLPVK